MATPSGTLRLDLKNAGHRKSRVNSLMGKMRFENYLARRARRRARMPAESKRESVC